MTDQEWIRKALHILNPDRKFYVKAQELRELYEQGIELLDDEPVGTDADAEVK